MRRGAVARRYARALFGLAAEQGRVAEVGRELAEVLELVRAEPALREVLELPLHPASERRAVAARICERLGTSALLANFLRYLIDQRRAQELEPIAGEYERLAEEAAGRMRGEVVAAAPLRPDQFERLRRTLSARTGREVELEVRVDPGLLGGAIARVGDLVFDGSLRSQLERLRGQLEKERGA